MISIYALKDPRDGVIRYVGRTAYPLATRLSGHLSKRREDTGLARWLSDLHALDMEPTILSIEAVDAEKAGQREGHWIRRHRRTILNAHIPARGKRGGGRPPVAPDGLRSFRFSFKTTPALAERFEAYYKSLPGEPDRSIVMRTILDQFLHDWERR